jgi:hypothetical protein
MPRSWIDSVPVCTDAYVYQTDLLCEDCAHEIARKLDKKKVIDDGDSDTYPQGPHRDGGGESDSFHFCGLGPKCINSVEIDRQKIGCPLGNPLTRDGAIRLREQVVEDLLSPTIFKRLLGRLLRRVWSDYTGGDYSSSVVRLDVSPAKLPTSLVNAVANHYEGSTIKPHAVLLADPDHVYLAVGHDDVMDLLRMRVDDEGNFNEVDVATIPRAAAEGYDAERLLRDADEDMAWD